MSQVCLSPPFPAKADASDRTAGLALLAGIPGLALTIAAAIGSTSLAIRVDLILTGLDMLVLVSAWRMSRPARRTRASDAASRRRREAMVCALAAACMCVSMTIVAWLAIQRMIAGGLAPHGPGVLLGIAANAAYAFVNAFILCRWVRRHRREPSVMARAQIYLFADKLSSNILLVVSLAAGLLLTGTSLAGFIDPVASLLIVLATARWTAPVVLDTVRALRKPARTAAAVIDTGA